MKHKVVSRSEWLAARNNFSLPKTARRTDFWRSNARNCAMQSVICRDERGSSAEVNSDWRRDFALQACQIFHRATQPDLGDDLATENFQRARLFGSKSARDVIDDAQ